MKRVFLVAFMVFCTSVVMMAKIKELPQAAQQFIEQYYPGSTILLTDCGNSSCKVLLDDNTQITFNKKGVWTEIDAEKTETGIPVSLIEGNALQVVQLKFADRKIIDASQDKKGNKEFELSNGAELKCDANWTVKAIEFGD